MITFWWIFAIALFAFLMLGLFGKVASLFMQPTPFIRFCERLWSFFEVVNLTIAKVIMICMLALLAIVIVARLLVRAD